MSGPRYWIGVASRDHVMKGVAGGFCQLSHGKAAPVKRLSPGDWLAYYAPREKMGEGEPVQAFVAIGRIKPGEPYAGEMGGGFQPLRRDVAFLKAKDAPIRPLLELYPSREDTPRGAMPSGAAASRSTKPTSG